MKGYPQAVLAALTIFFSLILPSCSKVQDFIEDHPSEIGKLCSIDSLTFNTGGGLQHFKIFYDGAGNPVELRQLDGLVGGIYGEDLHFRYDKKGRLTDVLQTDPGLTFVYLWNRYSYPSQRTIIDSTYEYQGNVNDPNPPNLPGLNVTINKMQLDEEGRPVKFLIYGTAPGVPPPYSYAVSYDRDGNQVIPGVTYDEKVNIYQTSRTWQLFYGDFSRNNPKSAVPGLPATPAAYNAYGLPTKFLGPFRTIFRHSFNVLTVIYSCDVAGPPRAY